MCSLQWSNRRDGVREHNLFLRVKNHWLTRGQQYSNSLELSVCALRALWTDLRPIISQIKQHPALFQNPLASLRPRCSLQQLVQDTNYLAFCGGLTWDNDKSSTIFNPAFQSCSLDKATGLCPRSVRTTPRVTFPRSFILLALGYWPSRQPTCNETGWTS